MRQFIEKIRGWKVVLLLITTIAVGSGAYYYVYRVTTVQPPLESYARVTREHIRSTVAATGTISAVNSVQVSSRVTGLITELRVKENDTVTAGQVLVILDDTMLQAQVAQCRAQLANYAAIYERSKRLTAAGGQSVQQMEADKTNYLVAQANYNNYAAQVEHYVIKSPIDGVVIGKPTPAGQTVAQGISSPQVIMTVADMSRMQIKVLVDETDIGKVQFGQRVEFNVDAYTNISFSGKVTNISKDATTSSNVVYYPVYVDVDHTQGLLYPTMTARVSIVTGESERALVVPQAAVKEESGAKVVQVVVEGKGHRVVVKTGLSDEEKIEIIDGLVGDEQVVIPAMQVKANTNGQAQGPPPLM